MNTPVAAQPQVAAPEAASVEVLVLFRYLVVILVIAGALGVCVYARMAVRGAALQLGTTRSQVAREETYQERLLVERALLREPTRLRDTAAALGLVTPVAVVSIDGAALR